MSFLKKQTFSKRRLYSYFSVCLKDSFLNISNRKYAFLLKFEHFWKTLPSANNMDIKQGYNYRVVISWIEHFLPIKGSLHWVHLHTIYILIYHNMSCWFCFGKTLLDLLLCAHAFVCSMDFEPQPRERGRSRDRRQQFSDAWVLFGVQIVTLRPIFSKTRDVAHRVTYTTEKSSFRTITWASMSKRVYFPFKGRGSRANGCKTCRGNCQNITSHF